MRKAIIPPAERPVMPALDVIDLMSSDEEDDSSRQQQNDLPLSTAKDTSDNIRLRNAAATNPAGLKSSNTTERDFSETRADGVRQARSQTVGSNPTHKEPSLPKIRTLSTPVIPSKETEETEVSLEKSSALLGLKNKPRSNSNDVNHCPSTEEMRDLGDQESGTRSQDHGSPSSPSKPTTPVVSDTIPLNPSNTNLITTSPKPPVETPNPILKRKPVDNLSSNTSKRTKATAPPPPPTPPATPQPARSTLWAIPAYQGPDANIKVGALPRHPSTPKTPPTPQHASLPLPTSQSTPLSKPLPSTPSTSSPLSSPPSTSASPTPSFTQTTTPWTTPQLLTLAQALQNNFDFVTFAAQHGKTRAQVLDTFSFLVFRPIMRYTEEKSGVARRLEREMREGAKEGEKVLREVNARERREEEIKRKQAGRGKGKGAEKSKGVDEAKGKGGKGKGKGLLGAVVCGEGKGR